MIARRIHANDGPRRGLQQSEALLRHAVESIGGGIAIWDGQGRLALCNDGYRRLFPGDPRGIVPGARYRELLRRALAAGAYPEAKGREAGWLAERLSERAAAGSTEQPLPDGRWVLVNRRRTADGRLAELRTDITELKRAQAALRESDQRFRCVVEAVPSALLIVRPDGAIEMVNAQAEQIFGYSREELLHLRVEALLPERYRAGHVALRSAYFSRMQARPMGAGRELHAVRKGGEEFPVEIGLSPIDTEHGLMALATIIDITQRKQAEQSVIEAGRRSEEALAALGRSQANLERAQHIARMGSVFRDFATDDVKWSEEAYRILGVSRNSFTATTANFLALVHPDDRAAVLRRWQAIDDGDADPEPLEFRVVRPDGAVRHLYTESEVARDAAGKPVSLSGIIRDVTENRAAQRREQQLQRQLVQAQKMEAIGNLTGGMAHDFNDILGIVIGNLDLLRDRVADDPEGQELLGDAVEAALHGAELNRRLLAFARQQPLQPARLDLNTLVEGIAGLLRRVVGEPIEIALDLDPGAWPVIVDAAQLEAAITNLAANARDAMPKGGRLTIATGNRQLDADYAAEHPDVASGDYAEIEVGDNGIGMSPEVMRRIFEPFYSTKEQGKGTGLGLSMVFGFVEQSGGHIYVYSEPGLGTTFRLYLPRAQAAAEAAEAKETAAVPLGDGETVLVVEDNPALRRVAVRQLRELGYAVAEADTAAGALAVIENAGADLVFSDVVMPGGTDGFELAAEIGRRWPRIPVVLTSGFSGANLPQAGAAASVRLLGKPYRKQELAAALRTALDRKRNGGRP